MGGAPLSDLLTLFWPSSLVDGGYFLVRGDMGSTKLWHVLPRKAVLQFFQTLWVFFPRKSRGPAPEVGWGGDAARFQLHSGPNLLIVPPQLMKNWVDEYEKNLDLKDTTFDWQLRTAHSLRLEEAKELEASDYGTVEYHQRRKRRGSIHFGKSLVRKDV